MSETHRKLSLPQRRAIACVGILIFLILYVIAVSEIGDLIPNVAWAQLLFYGLAGTAWGIPILPLISWSEGYKSRKKK